MCLLGPACKCSLPFAFGAYFVINSVPPFWNASMGSNCSDISSLLVVCCPLLDTRKRLLRHWFLHGDTGCIAPVNNISVSSSLTSLDCFWFKSGGSGDFPCIGFSRKGISNPWTKFRIFGSCVSLAPFEWNNFSLPVRGSFEIGFVGNRVLTGRCTWLTLKYWG